MRNLGRVFASSAGSRCQFFLGVLCSIGGIHYLVEILTLSNKLQPVSVSQFRRNEDSEDVGSGIRKSLNLLNTASAAGRFVQSPFDYNNKTKGLNWTNLTTRFQVPKEWAHTAGYSETLLDAIQVQGESLNVTHEFLPSQLDQQLLLHIRDKTFLMMGDSTTENMYSTICRCKRSHNSLEEVQGPMEGSNTECHEQPEAWCEGPSLKTCHMKMFNLTLHFLQGEYAIHPFGPMPYERGQNPVCEPDMNLASCLKKKWDVSCNNNTSLRCMANTSCTGARPPDMILVNVNLWFWFRMQWYGRFDEINFQDMPWSDVEDAYMSNMTTVVSALTDYMKSTKLVVLQTSPGTKTPSRVSLDRVMHINSAIRSLVVDLNLVKKDIPPIGLLELEHMGHMGWDREQFLYDDLHPQFAFNYAASNILLNVLASLD